MVTLVVPTRNRLHTLRLVAPSYYSVDLVDEIIFVDDGGTDDLGPFLAELGAQHPQTKTVLLRNEHREGAAACRNRGFRQAKNEFILFCDDDEYLEPSYAAVCLKKLQASGAGAVSGRRVQKRPDEAPQEAVARFGNGWVNAPPFRKWVCEYRIDARFDGDVRMPLTNAVILTPRALLERYGFDSFYSKGNGYREESDYQMNLYVNGHDILVTNDVHSIHLSRQECRTGGQRTSRFRRWYWSIYYTRYFYDKYYDRYARRIGLRMPRAVAMAVFAVYRAYVLFIQPFGRLVKGR